MILLTLASSITSMPNHEEFSSTELRTRISSELVDADEASFFIGVLDDREGLAPDLEGSSLVRTRPVSGLMGVIGARNEKFFKPPDPTPGN